MLTREICPICRSTLVAVNYIRDGVTHYRNSCNGCIRKEKKLKLQPPTWVRSGYKKKERCEMCNFKAKLPTKQLFVWYVDGNLRNADWVNLKTICANCQIELAGSRLPWKPAPIISDF